MGNCRVTRIVKVCGVLAVLVLMLSALLASGKAAEVTDAVFYERWNAVALSWEKVAVELNAGRFPYRRFQELDRDIVRLRNHKAWVKTKPESCK